MTHTIPNTSNAALLFAGLSLIVSLVSLVAFIYLYSKQNTLVEEQNALIQKQFEMQAGQKDIARYLYPTVDLRGTVERRNQNLCLVIRNYGNRIAYIESITIDNVPIQEHPLFEGNSYVQINRSAFLREIPSEGETIFVVSMYPLNRTRRYIELIPSPINIDIKHVKHKPEPNYSFVFEYMHTKFQVSFPEKINVPSDYQDIIKKKQPNEN